MLYRDSPHREIEILMSFDYLQVFGLDEDENNKEGNFLFENSDKKYHKIMIIFKHIVIIVEIHFISHVDNGICIITYNVIWYNYTNTNTNTKVCISTHILVIISIVYVQI